MHLRRGRARKKNESHSTQVKHIRKMPNMTPDEILETAPKGVRVIRVDANVVAYFGDFFHAWKESVKREIISAPKIGHSSPANTASSHSRF